MAIDDSLEYQLLLRKIIAGRGLDVKVLESAENIVKEAEKYAPDLILLDITLPGISGFNACTQLKENPLTASIPIIFLTARADVSDKVLGFKIGADDYMVKPFDPQELLARVESKVRKQQEQNIISMGKFVLNLDELTLNVLCKESPDKVSLSSLEFKLLFYFMKNKNRVLSREQIMDNVWGPNVHLTDRSVDVHISFLRKKNPEIKRSLRSVYGAGYKFIV